MVVGVNTAEHDDAAGNARRFQQQHKLTYPILLDADGKVRAAYGVSAFPTNMVIDADGKVAAVILGFNRAEIDRTLQSLMPR